MSSTGVGDAGYPVDTRRKLLDAALELTSRHGMAGTSLQMIADELGVTKAAIYYHFRTRDQLLVALLEPILHQVWQVAEAAEAQRTPRAQIEAMVQGYARVVAKNRSLAAVTAFDPVAHRILQSQPDWSEAIARQLALLMQSDSGGTGLIKATALMTGLAGAASGAPVDIDEDELINELCDVGRRIMGLPRPRRQSDAKRNGDSTARQPPEPAPGRWKDFLAEA